MFDTDQEKRDFWASEELWQDYMYQPSMDTAYHYWLQPKWEKEFKAWLEKSISLSVSTQRQRR